MRKVVNNRFLPLITFEYLREIMITLGQIEAALGILRLKRPYLANSLGVNTATFNTYFTGQSEMKPSLNASIQEWFENSGILFIEDEGVKRNTASIVKYEGEIGFKSFMDDVFETIKETPGTYYVSNVNEKNWLRWLGQEDAKRRRDRTTALKGVNAKILIKTGDELQTATDYAEYRTLPESMFKEDVSHYIYGDKLALIKFSEKNVKVTAFKNTDFAEAQRIWFEAIWNQASKT